MLDLKSIAKELAKKKENGDSMDEADLEVDALSTADALRDMFKAMRAGEFEAAAEAFKAAVVSCEDYEE
jgi:hypothetical protein